MPPATIRVYIALSAGLLGSAGAVVALVLAAGLSMRIGLLLLLVFDVVVIAASYAAVRRSLSSLR